MDSEYVRTGFPGGGGTSHSPVESRHFSLPPDLPFTAEQRPSTTILFGHLTPKHERLIRAVFRGEGYQFENLPLPSRSTFLTGKEYCSNGLCNPNYFTAGSLIEYLQELEAKGMTREEIVERYLYFTLADCGPCRFGIYQYEYRQALREAGFPGFRIITFQNHNFISKGASEPGLKFTADIGFGALVALILGDLLYEAAYRIRPFEEVPDSTNEAMEDCLQLLSYFLKNRKRYEILQDTPAWISRRLADHDLVMRRLNTFGKYRDHLYGRELKEVLERCWQRLDEVQLDRTRVKPIVKITGEFYSHLAESYANYNMFEFLEQEGAQVEVDTIAGHLLYWLHRSKLNQERKKGLQPPHPKASWWQVRKRLANRLSDLKKPLLLSLASGLYGRHYRRLNQLMGGFAHSPLNQDELSDLAQDFYHPLTRGGEGYLEVAKSIYYTRHHLCHMILSLKPFGCMPSTQSDGVMTAVTSRFDDLHFVSVETSGDADINALSRVQMALADARRKAQTEFELALKQSRRTLEEIRSFIQERPILKKPSLRIPHQKGFTGVAANYILFVSNLMKR